MSKLLLIFQACFSLEHPPRAPVCADLHYSSQALSQHPSSAGLCVAPTSLWEGCTSSAQKCSLQQDGATTCPACPMPYTWDLLNTANRNKKSHRKDSNLLIREEDYYKHSRPCPNHLMKSFQYLLF